MKCRFSASTQRREGLRTRGRRLHTRLWEPRMGCECVPGPGLVGQETQRLFGCSFPVDLSRYLDPSWPWTSEDKPLKATQKSQGSRAPLSREFWTQANTLGYKTMQVAVPPKAPEHEPRFPNPVHQNERMSQSRSVIHSLLRHMPHALQLLEHKKYIGDPGEIDRRGPCPHKACPPAGGGHQN